MPIASAEFAIPIATNVFYKNIKNPNVPNQYFIKRSGISSSDVFIPENNNESIQQYAQRYEIADQAIKPIDPSVLQDQIKRENSALANTAVPQAQNLLNKDTISNLYNIQSNASRAIASIDPAISNIKNMGTKVYDTYNTYVQ